MSTTDAPEPATIRTPAESRAALVTGAGRHRVGRYVAEALAARGYDVAIHYRHSAEEAREAVSRLRERGSRAEAVHAELADEADVEAMVRTTLERFGRLDVLVNTAAVWQRKRLEEVTAADVRRHFEANVLGTFLCARHAGLAMAARPDGGCIINFGDWAEARPYPDYPAYFATKGAIPTLTRDLAVELGIRNPRVRVNAVLPGPVMLPTDLPDAERQEAIDSTLVRREGHPANVVQAVLYLIDNDFVTGSCLTVDGGRSVFAGGL